MKSSDLKIALPPRVEDALEFASVDGLGDMRIPVYLIPSDVDGALVVLGYADDAILPETVVALCSTFYELGVALTALGYNVVLERGYGENTGK